MLDILFVERRTQETVETTRISNAHGNDILSIFSIP